MVGPRVKLDRRFFCILAALMYWTSTAPIGALLLTKPLLYGIVVAMVLVASVFLMVLRYRAASTEVSLIMSVGYLIAPLALTTAPLAIVIGMARFLPWQYSALLLLYVLGIFAFVAAGGLHLRRGIIEREQGKGPGQDATRGRPGGS